MSTYLTVVRDDFSQSINAECIQSINTWPVSWPAREPIGKNKFEVSVRFSEHRVVTVFEDENFEVATEVQRQIVDSLVALQNGQGGHVTVTNGTVTSTGYRPAADTVRSGLHTIELQP